MRNSYILPLCYPQNALELSLRTHILATRKSNRNFLCRAGRQKFRLLFRVASTYRSLYRMRNPCSVLLVHAHPDRLLPPSRHFSLYLPRHYVWWLPCSVYKTLGLVPGPAEAGGSRSPFILRAAHLPFCPPSYISRFSANSTLKSRTT
ncbi:hypothetical protein BT96DRAFT_355193 [Gymnopus androsaceus JB14]|uniref:Uncharacterized protein n=1 Tax=Gymnopus androsaceus JB14 TaxID=1447944 RepID=A0A6A4GXE2_9AGAR|nr:hypothetical protein BT96DRAFT_355193 [Gymnopus androsaceus JB14]